jgi:tRNA pseudouridine38-40 synthase
MRLFIELSYNGTKYSGWQIQNNAITIQALLERALSIALSQEISVVGAGRTDTGVSAINYIAHFDCNTPLPTRKQLLYKLNAILNNDIVVTNIYHVEEQAHARFDATSRSYEYRVHTSKDPFACYSYFCKFALDLEKMNRAASYLIGTKDFSSFEKSGGDNATSICTITDIGWESEDYIHYKFHITANRFLRNMVRAIVGTLLDVGKGKLKPEEILDVVEKRDRCAAGQSVPGEPLRFLGAKYPYKLIEIED